jgi:hypothetical protein
VKAEAKGKAQQKASEPEAEASKVKCYEIAVYGI